MSDKLVPKTTEENIVPQEQPQPADIETKDVEQLATASPVEIIGQPAAVNKKSKKTLIFIIAGAAVVVIVAAVLLISYFSKSAEARRVDALISEIGTVTLDSEKKIKKAEKEAEALSKEDYEQISNVDTLKKAREDFDLLLDKKEAAEISKKIKAIGKVTLDSKSKINEARSAYDAASGSVMKLVDNYDTLTEAENTLFGLQATKVVTLINDIGTVNENSEAKIKKAENAYNSLSAEAKGKVTNYSTLTKARDKFQSTQKDAKKKNMNNALSKLKKKTDDFRDITWYEPKTRPEYINVRSYVLPYIGITGSLDDGESTTVLYLVIDYYGDDWIFYDTIYINADGKKYSKTIYSTERDNAKGKVWEFYNESASESDCEWLNAIANSKNAVIRFSGKYHYDLTISDSDREAIKDVMEAYEAILDYTGTEY
ncbi:MAG: hypothetical protein UFA98_11765 [Ruminococcus sp.]|nr:hypothetical protein [Ruminococcus sp.]